MNRAATSILVLAPLLVSCGPRQPPAAAPAEDVAPAAENAALGLRVTELPEGIRMAGNEGDRLVFDAASDGVPGNLLIGVGPPVLAGINLAAEANGFGERAAASGGKFFGGNQIVTPYGSGYVARVLGGDGMEEIRVFLLHPGDSDRLLTVSLGYPPGGPEVSRARMNQVIELLGALEPLDAPAAE